MEGLPAAVKFINKFVEAAARKAGIKPVDYCAHLHDRDKAVAFANAIKDAYCKDLLLLDGGVALTKSFLNAFGVFVHHDESGSSVGETTSPSSHSSPSGDAPAQSSTAVGTTTTSCRLHRDCILVHPKARQGKQGPDVVHLSQEDVKQQVEGIINTKRLNTLLEQVKGCPVAVDCVLLHA
ncbi:hypothetical protein BC831DRAFT_465994, partial [Entophlyctis helioformis]